MENSHIQWTDHTFNPWIGCTKVSPGCTHCYAEALNQRWWKGENWGKGAPRSRTSASNWKGPRKWNRIGCGDCDPCLHGQRCPLVYHPRVFCASLADWLDDEAQIEFLADLLALIHATPNLDWLLLTKRPENFFLRLNLAVRFNADRCGGICTKEKEPWSRAYDLDWQWMNESRSPANVWIGTTVEDQTRADLRIPQLLAIPARVRFLSCEPLLSPVVLGSRNCHVSARAMRDRTIDWVICGGESGRGAREMSPDWARELRFQCESAGVAFFMKQMGGSRDARGELEKIPEDLRIRQFPQL